MCVYIQALETTGAALSTAKAALDATARRLGEAEDKNCALQVQYICVCTCRCACIYIHTHMCVYTYICIYVCICTHT